MRKISSFLILLLLLFSTLTVRAEEADQTSNTVKEIRLDRRETVKANAEERMAVREEKRASKEAALSEKREAFKERLQSLKDKRKKALVERIDVKLAEINKRRTDHMVKIIEKLEDIANRLDERINKAEDEGKNVTAARAAMEKARDAIATAQSTISSQAGKEYVIQIGEEAGLKGTVGTTMSQLQADLRTTHKTLVDAKQAVMNAAREVLKLRAEKTETSTSTNSAEPQ